LDGKATLDPPAVCHFLNWRGLWAWRHLHPDSSFLSGESGSGDDREAMAGEKPRGIQPIPKLACDVACTRRDLALTLEQESWMKVSPISREMDRMENSSTGHLVCP
jgi:hypothetical protein